MPIYEYSCDACGEVRDAYVPASADRETPPLPSCPCGCAFSSLAGLSAPAVGRQEVFGFVAQDGRPIRASLWGDDTKRRSMTQTGRQAPCFSRGKG